ncbi:hypothetical protein V1478_017448 [Vespula squamosa]|uniref:Uncharacterized protein n=1 Tax=Vespula squamosa TaxID=30214 RepID=A0ABD1ZXC7_VESSQ
MFEEVMDGQIDLHELPVNEHRPTNKCELVGTQTNPDALRFMDVTSVRPFSLQRKRTPCDLGPNTIRRFQKRTCPKFELDVYAYSVSSHSEKFVPICKPDKYSEGSMRLNPSTLIAPQLIKSNFDNSPMISL